MTFPSKVFVSIFLPYNEKKNALTFTFNIKTQDYYQMPVMVLWVYQQLSLFQQPQNCLKRV